MADIKEGPLNLTTIVLATEGLDINAGLIGLILDAVRLGTPDCDLPGQRRDVAAEAEARSG